MDERKRPSGDQEEDGKRTEEEMRWERERRTFRVSSSINRIVIDWQEFFSRHDCRSPDSIFPLSQIGRETIQRLWHTGQKKCFFSVRVRESPLPTHLAKSILSPISFYPRVAHLRMKRRGHFVSALSIRIRRKVRFGSNFPTDATEE